jgi:hypothetical protein
MRVLSTFLWSWGLGDAAGLRLESFVISYLILCLYCFWYIINEVVTYVRNWSWRICNMHLVLFLKPNITHLVQLFDMSISVDDALSGESCNIKSSLLCFFASLCAISFLPPLGPAVRPFTVWKWSLEKFGAHHKKPASLSESYGVQASLAVQCSSQINKPCVHPIGCVIEKDSTKVFFLRDGTGAYSCAAPRFTKAGIGCWSVASDAPTISLSF